MANLADFAEYLKTSDLPAFSPKPYYERKTESLIFYMRNERSTSIRLNSMLTLFVSMKDKSLVGIEVKGIPRLLKIADSFNVGVFNHKIRLGVFLAFAMTERPDRPALNDEYCDDLATYQDEVIDRDELEPATC